MGILESWVVCGSSACDGAGVPASVGTSCMSPATHAWPWRRATETADGCNAGGSGVSASLLQELQQILVEQILVGIGDAVGTVGIDDQTGTFDQRGGGARGGVDRHDLVVAAM